MSGIESFYGTCSFATKKEEKRKNYCVNSYLLCLVLYLANLWLFLMSVSVSHLVVFSQLNVQVLDSRRLSIPNRNRLRSRADREDCPSVHLRCSAGLGSCIQPSTSTAPNALGLSVCFCPLLFSPSESCLLPVFLPHSTINSFIPFASQTGARTGCPQMLCPWHISPSHSTPSGYLSAIHRNTRWPRYRLDCGEPSDLLESDHRQVDGSKAPIPLHYDHFPFPQRRTG